MGSFTDSCAAFRWPGPMTHSAGDSAAGRAPKRAAMRPLPGDRCSSSVRFPEGCFGGWWAGTGSGAFPRRGILRGPHPVGGQEERRHCGDQREEGEQSVRSRRLLAQGRQPGVGGLDIETAYDQRALPRDPFQGRREDDDGIQGDERRRNALLAAEQPVPPPPFHVVSPWVPLSVDVFSMLNVISMSGFLSMLDFSPTPDSIIGHPAPSFRESFHKSIDSAAAPPAPAPREAHL